MKKLRVVTVVTAVALTGGLAVHDFVYSNSSTPDPVNTKMCEDWGYMTDGECFAAGAIRFAYFSNLQGSGQFCKWKAANPGEWSRLQGFAQTNIAPVTIITWLGASIRNSLEAYFGTGAPTFTIPPNTAPNICRTPLKAPTIGKVTAGQDSVTIEIIPP